MGGTLPGNNNAGVANFIAGNHTVNQDSGGPWTLNFLGTNTVYTFNGGEIILDGANPRLFLGGNANVFNNPVSYLQPLTVESPCPGCGATFAGGMPTSSAGITKIGPGFLTINATNLVLVPNTLPVGSIKELIAYAKARPGQLNYASSGNGTIVHLTSEAFKAQAGLFITHIPYRGTALAIPDLVSNKVQLLFDSVVSGMPHVKDGKLKALAVTGLKRSALAPEIPTVAESGLPGFESMTWFGVYGPKGMAADVARQWNAEFMKAMQSAEVQDRLARLGAEPVTSGGPDQFAARVKADSSRWAELIKARKITLE